MASCACVMQISWHRNWKFLFKMTLFLLKDFVNIEVNFAYFCCCCYLFHVENKINKKNSTFFLENIRILCCGIYIIIIILCKGWMFLTILSYITFLESVTKKLVKSNKSNLFLWNCISGSFELFPSSKIDFWPVLELQKMELGQKNFFRRIHLFEFWFHDFFLLWTFFLIFWPTVHILKLVAWLGLPK